MIAKLLNYLKKYTHHEKSGKKLALSFCMGNYIAISPFLGMHTIMIFVAVWMFNLSFPVTFAAAYGINNPWTAIPIYTLDYVFGYWIMHSLTGYGAYISNPSCMYYIDYFFEQKLGFAKPCIWSFLIGGNILALISSFLLYPIMKKIFSKLTAQAQEPA